MVASSARRSETDCAANGSRNRGETDMWYTVMWPAGNGEPTMSAKQGPRGFDGLENGDRWLAKCE